MRLVRKLNLEIERPFSALRGEFGMLQRCRPLQAFAATANPASEWSRSPQARASYSRPDCPREDRHRGEA